MLRMKNKLFSKVFCLSQGKHDGLLLISIKCFEQIGPIDDEAADI